MKKIIGSFITVLCLLGMASWANVAQAYTWQDIKQEVGPLASKPATGAYLKVYTKTAEVNDGGYLWVRGQRYTIFSDEGKKIRSVSNDNSPDAFMLPPGKYVIVPDDGQYKNEIIGAILVPGRITEVHMMGG